MASRFVEADEGFIEELELAELRSENEKDCLDNFALYVINK